MNLRPRFVLSIGLLGLVCLTMPGALWADAFSFSFSNTLGGSVDGTVTGEVLGLTNNGVPGPASQVIITGFPTPFEALLGAAPITTIPTWSVLVNSFTESGGAITSGAFLAEPPNSAYFFELYPTEDFAEIDGLATTNQTEGSLTFAPLPVPEPGTSTLTLTGLGLLGLVVVTRKRAALRHLQGT